MLVFYHDELTEEDIKILSLVSEITKNEIAKMQDLQRIQSE